MVRSARQPKYIQIKNAIVDQISYGQLKPGQQVYSISEIMGKFAVSKVTAVRALTDLETEGIVTREHGRGTFVSSPKEENTEVRTRKSIAVITPEMTNPFYVEVVGKVEKILREEGVVVEIYSTDYQVEVEKDIVKQMLKENHVSGIVLMSTPQPLSMDEFELNIPMIVIDRCPPDLQGKCIYISCDNFKGAMMQPATWSHLDIKIAYINIPGGAPERLKGFKSALTEKGLSLAEDMILTVTPGQQFGGQIQEFVKREKPTAVFTVNDMIAMQTMQALRSSGYQIPEDISLIGYDNVEASKYLEIPLTTIQQYEEQIGRRAAECILEGINAPEGTFRPREIVIVPSLVERASTGPPKG